MRAAERLNGEATRIVAIRHGETAWNAEMRMQGQLDIRAQRRAAAGRPRASPWRSPTKASTRSSRATWRARPTPRGDCRRGGLPIVDRPGLRERGFGIFEG